MISTPYFALLLICVAILFIGAPRQIETKPRVGNVIWSILRPAEQIPAASLRPHLRVKRVKRDAFDGTSDQGPEFQNASEHEKEHFPAWDDARGEPQLN
ncbi:uncharacterized protein LOC128867984 [Anastrepha ludens]|uniref:uncharacterized protein LOC128867984 n=1 Tax=Anastrepha ludens TaxID=28586 RepID=UPI0023B06448|nr:uncharacterized protein LOC128867984 [Anastrepha ludens]